MPFQERKMNKAARKLARQARVDRSKHEFRMEQFFDYLNYDKGREQNSKTLLKLIKEDYNWRFQLIGNFYDY